MFAYLEGRVAEKRADALVMDVGGVGFLVSTNPATVQRASGDPFRVYTRLVVKEDSWDLYGFATREEKEMFDRLTSVSGVGPKMALGLLSALTVSDLALAILTGDLKAIKAVPGIGAKTAQRLMLELKDKVNQNDLDAYAGEAVALPEGGPEKDAVAALMSLGYASGEAAQAVDKVRGQASSVDELLRLALRAMSRL